MADPNPSTNPSPSPGPSPNANATPSQGVYKIGQRWVAKAMRDGSLKSLGAFGTAQEAARAYARECSAEHGGRPDERPSARSAMVRLG